MARDEESTGGRSLKRRIIAILVISAIALVTVVIIISILSNDEDAGGSYRLTAIDSTHSNYGRTFPPVANFSGSEFNLNSNGTFSVRIVYFDLGFNRDVVYFAAIGTFTTEERAGVRGHVLHFVHAYYFTGSGDPAPLSAGDLFSISDSFHGSPTNNTVILNVFGSLFTFSL